MGVSGQGRENPCGGLLESQISLSPPCEAGSPTQGWGALSAPGPLPSLASCAHVSLRLGWGRGAAASWERLTPRSPPPPGNGSSESLEGHLRVAHSSFLPSSTWRRHAPSRVHSFLSWRPGSEGALSPRDPLSSLPPSFRWPLLRVGRRGSFPGVREAGQTWAPALRDGARAARTWSYPKRNHEVGVFQRKEKGREASREGALQDLGPGKKRPLEYWWTLPLLELEKARVLWAKVAFLAASSSGSKCF